MIAEKPKKNQDPLGILHMGQLISKMSAKVVGTPFSDEFSLLSSSYDNALEAYSLLRDRYQLLKESNALLAEELAWLRDQCDDFAVERAELLHEIANQPSTGSENKS